MNLLLLSLGLGALPDFLQRTATTTGQPLRLGYVTDAAVPHAGAPFVTAERSAIADLGHDLVEILTASTSPQTMRDVLDEIDALYVASGSTFALLGAMRSAGADRAIVERVRDGLPYVGTSAGAIVAGPSIEPASLMDDPHDAPGLRDTTGLQLIDAVVIPHADGKLPPYPPALIERTLRRYGNSHNLIPLRDDQAMLVDDAGSRIISSPTAP